MDAVVFKRVFMDLVKFGEIIVEVGKDADAAGGGSVSGRPLPAVVAPPTSDEVRAAFAAAEEREVAECCARNEGIPLMIESVVELDPDRGSGGVRRL